MKHDLPALDALKVFESAARQLSFSLAAQELCISKGAVSYQIRKLEENLDCALFRRSVRQVYLTDAGQQLLKTVQRLFAELERTLESIKPVETGHDVLVGATTYVALRWLSPRISRFSELHPDISILLQHSVNAEDFSIQDVDFAIRWGEMHGRSRRRRPLEMPMPLFPVCSPRLLERHPRFADKTDLERREFVSPALQAIPLLCEDRTLDLWQTWVGDEQPPLANPRRVIADANEPLHDLALGDSLADVGQFELDHDRVFRSGRRARWRRARVGRRADSDVRACSGTEYRSPSHEQWAPPCTRSRSPRSAR